jgi:hypothetical protein
VAENGSSGRNVLVQRRPYAMAGERQSRAARNEDLFRRLNERLHALSEHAQQRPPGPATEGAEQERFVCECSSTECSKVVALTAGEYTAVRATGRRFLVFPDRSHTSPDLEEVVERHERYWVVQKKGEAGLEADALADRPSEPL